MVAARPRLTQPCDGRLTPCSCSLSEGADGTPGWGAGADVELSTDPDGAGAAGAALAGGGLAGGGLAGGGLAGGGAAGGGAAGGGVAGGALWTGGAAGTGLPPAVPAGGDAAAGVRAGRTSTHPMWISSGSVRA